MQAWPACRMIHRDACARVHTFGICLGCHKGTAGTRCAKELNKGVRDERGRC